MAVPIIPKSEMRLEQAHNIMIGYGAVPAVILDGGQIAWGLPGNLLTLSRHTAEKAAARLDAVIREGMQKSPRKTLV